MRVVGWNPNKMDETFEDIAIDRLVKAAEVVKDTAKRNCPVGTVSRPMYETGPHAEKRWTARDAGQLKRSIRVVRKKTKSGKAFTRKRNVRIYAGNYLAYYAAIVEYRTPYLRRSLGESMNEIKSIIGIN